MVLKQHIIKWFLDEYVHKDVCKHASRWNGYVTCPKVGMGVCMCVYGAGVLSRPLSPVTNSISTTILTRIKSLLKMNTSCHICFVHQPGLMINGLL